MIGRWLDKGQKSKGGEIRDMECEAIERNIDGRGWGWGKREMAVQPGGKQGRERWVETVFGVT